MWSTLSRPLQHAHFSPRDAILAAYPPKLLKYSFELQDRAAIEFGLKPPSRRSGERIWMANSWTSSSCQA